MHLTTTLKEKGEGDARKKIAERERSDAPNWNGHGSTPICLTHWWKEKYSSLDSILPSKKPHEGSGLIECWREKYNTTIQQSPMNPNSTYRSKEIEK